jgi:hypothetical protein
MQKQPSSPIQSKIVLHMSVEPSPGMKEIGISATGFFQMSWSVFPVWMGQITCWESQLRSYLWREMTDEVKVNLTIVP